uniref:(northern house mosquito) hypothetical protein n=1 Tax=Culex pipiens TaxID=7175 RepID=A0A8D8FYB0_CULPI
MTDQCVKWSPSVTDAARNSSRSSTRPPSDRSPCAGLPGTHIRSTRNHSLRAAARRYIRSYTLHIRLTRSRPFPLSHNYSPTSCAKGQHTRRVRPYTTHSSSV